MRRFPETGGMDAYVDAEVEFTPVMNADDLKAGVEKMG